MPDIPASRLWGCASKSVGFSGRALRKLTGLMYIKYIHAEVCSMDEAVRALGWTVDDELERRGGER